MSCAPRDACRVAPSLTMLERLEGKEKRSYKIRKRKRQGGEEGGGGNRERGRRAGRREKKKEKEQERKGNGL